MRTKNYYYVYYSYEEWGRGYVGYRGCNCLPEKDIKYLGSFKDKIFKPTKKVILKVYRTEKEAIKAEIALHNFYQVDINPHFANKAKQTSEKFCHKSIGSQNKKYKPRDWIHPNFGIQRNCSVTDLIKKFPEFKLSQGHLSSVALQDRNEHKGWRILYSKRKIRGTQRHWYHPEHGIYLNMSNRGLCSMFSEKTYYHNMLSRVIKGKMEHHKGWMLYHTVLEKEQLLNI